MNTLTLAVALVTVLFAWPAFGQPRPADKPEIPPQDVFAYAMPACRDDATLELSIPQIGKMSSKSIGS